MTSTGASPGVKTALLAAFALVAFAGNSVLCRQALGSGAIDPAAFSAIRLLSGAATLVALSCLRRVQPVGNDGGWKAAVALFVYAAGFSWAYVSLTTGTGALILFGAVQVTMIVAGVRSGERPGPAEWWGLTLAVAGLCILVFPGLSAPSFGGLILMTIAGIAWGVYSLSGRGAGNAIAMTTANFLRAAPLACVLVLGAWPGLHASAKGVILALLSGAVASAVGYVAWYAALPGMSATLAATIQLVVPVLAAAVGIVLLSERVTVRLVVAGVAILGGVASAVAGRSGLWGRRPNERPET